MTEKRKTKFVGHHIIRDNNFISNILEGKILGKTVKGRVREGNRIRGADCGLLKLSKNERDCRKQRKLVTATRR